MSIQTLVIDQLVLSENNVRKSRDEGFIQELAENIFVHGILQNLVVAKAGPLFTIEAGGNRYFAVKWLIEQGRVECDYPIPVLVKTGDSCEMSLSENVMRQSMNAIDESEAFTWLSRREGLPLSDIALRFGKTELYVKQRLKLADLHASIKSAYLRNELSLSALMAFTVTDDQDMQCRVFESCGPDPHPHGIKRALLNTAVSDTGKLARFVTVEAYQAAGGEMSRDLFEQTTYLTDAGLLEKMALDKLQAIGKELGDWKWIQVAVSGDWEFIQKCGRLPKVETPRTQELKAQLEALEAGFSEFSDGLPEVMSAEQEEKLAKKEGEIDALRDAIDASFEVSADDRAKGGCLVYLDWEGKVEMVSGLVHPDDKKAAKVVEDGEAEVPAKAKFSQSLVDDLQCYRLAATKVELADNFAAAFDLMLCELVCRVLPGYFPRLLDVTVGNTFSETSRKDVEASDDHQALQANMVAQLGELGVADRTEVVLDAIVKLPQKTKKSLFSVLVARSLMKPTGSLNEGAFGDLEKRLKVDLRAHWTPSADNLFSRVNAPTLCQWLTSLTGETVAPGQLKKKQLVQKMEAAFQSESPTSKDWLPEIFIEKIA